MTTSSAIAFLGRIVMEKGLDVFSMRSMRSPSGRSGIALW
jgi:hypothetical protein